jgi:hypothetical protein
MPTTECIPVYATALPPQVLTPSAPLCLQILSEDYAKAAFLCADRSICLHAKYGAHYRTRIPTAGRDLAYVASTAGASQSAVATAFSQRKKETCTARCWRRPDVGLMSVCCWRQAPLESKQGGLHRPLLAAVLNMSSMPWLQTLA